jgi:hypothetical protein
MLASISFLFPGRLFISGLCSGFVCALISFSSLTTEIGQKMELTERTGRPQQPQSLGGYAAFKIKFTIQLLQLSIIEEYISLAV